MMEGAFTQPKRTNPTALAIVVLMHGAALTALALAKGEQIRDALSNPKIYQIEEEKPPPVEPPKPVERVVKPQQETVIDRPDPIIKTEVTPDFVEWKPLPPVDRIVIPEPGPITQPKLEPQPGPPNTVKPARAKANLASYVSDEDYPPNAIRNEEQGTTRFRLQVGADGKVTDCSVTASSGSTALDVTTCRLMKQRARFTPARGSDGNATSDSVASAIRWVLPAD